MKIAISSKENNLNSEISEVFGRSPYFLIVGIENGKIKEIEVMENKSIDQAGGAGISAAQLVAEKNVEALITGNAGPRALDVLRQFNIEIYYGEGVAKDALQQFIEGKLKKIN